MFMGHEPGTDVHILCTDSNRTHYHVSIIILVPAHRPTAGVQRFTLPQTSWGINRRKERHIKLSSNSIHFDLTQSLYQGGFCKLYLQWWPGYSLTMWTPSWYWGRSLDSQCSGCCCHHLHSYSCFVRPHPSSSLNLLMKALPVISILRE